MKVAITGATGFLGSALSKKLKVLGHELLELGSRDADLRKFGALDHLEGKFDQIYHLAAWTQAGDFCIKHPGEQWIINQQINTTVLDWWSRMQPQAKMITIGTSCSYAPGTLLEERNYLDGAPIDSLFSYAHTKRMLLVGQKALERQFALRWLTVVPSTLYGPGYHTDKRQMHFIFDLIRKILLGKLKNERVILWGDGFQKRELIYIDDFVDSTITLANSIQGELINIGAGEEFTIKSFAETISAIVGYDSELIEYDRSRYVGAISKCLSVRRLEQLIPDRKTTPLGAGLKSTIDWFLSRKQQLLD